MVVLKTYFKDFSDFLRLKAELLNVAMNKHENQIAAALSCSATII